MAPSWGVIPLFSFPSKRRGGGGGEETQEEEIDVQTAVEEIINPLSSPSLLRSWVSSSPRMLLRLVVPCARKGGSGDVPLPPHASSRQRRAAGREVPFSLGDQIAPNVSVLRSSSPCRFVSWPSGHFSHSTFAFVTISPSSSFFSFSFPTALASTSLEKVESSGAIRDPSREMSFETEGRKEAPASPMEFAFSFSSFSGRASTEMRTGEEGGGGRNAFRFATPSSSLPRSMYGTTKKGTANVWVVVVAPFFFLHSIVSGPFRSHSRHVPEGSTVAPIARRPPKFSSIPPSAPIPSVPARERRPPLLPWLRHFPGPLLSLSFPPPSPSSCVRLFSLS